MNLPEKKIKRTHLYSQKFILSVLLFSITIIITNNDILDFSLAFLALILVIYSAIETRIGYVILEIKNNQLIINTPLEMKVTVAINEISYIEEHQSKNITVYYIHLKNKKYIKHTPPFFLYSKIPLYETHSYELALEKETREFFKLISDYLDKSYR